MTDPEYLTRQENIAGLRDMADWLERHPDLTNPLMKRGELRLVTFKTYPDPFAVLAAMPGRFDDVEITGEYVAFGRTFGPVTYRVCTARCDNRPPAGIGALTAEEKWRAVWGPTVDALTALDAAKP
jgi:hypothetical protein